MKLTTEQRADRAAAHKSKMAEKKRLIRDRRAPRAAKVPANLSRHHPDFGLTMAEHRVRKAERASA